MLGFFSFWKNLLDVCNSNRNTFSQLRPVDRNELVTLSSFHLSSCNLVRGSSWARKEACLCLFCDPQVNRSHQVTAVPCPDKKNGIHEHSGGFLPGLSTQNQSINTALADDRFSLRHTAPILNVCFKAYNNFIRTLPQIASTASNDQK